MYKYLIIDQNNNEAILKNSLRDISSFIHLITNKKISHNTIRLRFLKNTYFYVDDIIIKRLIW